MANTKVFRPKNILKLSRPQCSVIEKSLCETGFCKKVRRNSLRGTFDDNIPVLQRRLLSPKQFPWNWQMWNLIYLLIPFLLAFSLERGNRR